MSRSTSQANEHVALLNRLLKLLRNSNVPGPQLFRLEKEFKTTLGEGGEGNVCAIDQACADHYRKSGRRILSRWPLDVIAIKRHQKSVMGSIEEASLDRRDLVNRLRAAEWEIRTLSPNLFRGNPNIVQLKGWGLCLDTIENPQSQCCGSLQMPLLVLERAKMNLLEFLQRELFPPSPLCQESLRPEEGRVSWTQNRYHELLRPARPGTARHYWNSVAGWMGRWTGFDEDPFNIVRLLCIDIGHGLGSLHQQSFTHGDLKPQNVLVFRTGLKWTAKLCDFGHTHFHKGNPSGSGGFLYGGTRSWQPPAGEVFLATDEDKLRRCDLYVYGLVVWSAFYLKGEAPEIPSLEEATKAGRVFRNELQWIPGNHHRLALRIDDVLSKTLCGAADRDATPWKYLYKNLRHDVSRAKKGIHKVKNNDPDMRRTFWGSRSRARGTDKARTETITLQLPLSKEQKLSYLRKRWWSKQIERNDPSDVQGTDSNIERPSETPLYSAIGGRTQIIEESFAPASFTYFTNDENPNRRDIFSERHRGEVGPLIKEMTNILENLVLPNQFPSSKELQKHFETFLSNSERFADLYCYARFRSRIPLDWWRERTRSSTNILFMALQAIPAVDVHTLAWLCNGPIGEDEVKSLPGSFAPWRVIINPIFLDESERLDRFLLLLQFGASIEKEVSVPSELGFGRGSRSILRWYLRSCRPATLPVVIKEICRRFNLVKNSDQISPSTKAHMTGSDENRTSGWSTRPQWSLKGTVTSELYSIDPTGRLSQLWQDGIKDGYMAGFEISRVTQAPVEDSPNAPVETTPLLQPANGTTMLPLGWKKHTSPGVRSGDYAYYEDEFTSSITLTKPEVSLMELRQIKIGVLKGIGPSIHLDLAPYTAQTMGLKALDTLDEVADRFPFYDDRWFAMEWKIEATPEDVLKNLRDISSFAIRIDIASALSKVIMLSKLTLNNIFAGFILVATLALLLGLIVLVFFILFQLLPAFAVGERPFGYTLLVIAIVSFPLTLAFCVLFIGGLRLYHGERYIY
ncbi:hypothetical protein ACEPPN_019461 [Leptodophora sp. 'Broadleaf-Isolate-01']